LFPAQRLAVHGHAGARDRRYRQRRPHRGDLGGEVADTELDKSSGIEITDPTVFGAPVTINGRYNLGTSLVLRQCLRR
jgi:hypothetical protein